MRGATQKTYHPDCGVCRAMPTKRLSHAYGRKHPAGNLACFAHCSRSCNRGRYYLAHYPAPEGSGTMVAKERSGL